MGKKKRLTGEMPKMDATEIYLNVTKLEDGKYELTIMNKNRPIKKTTFYKN